MRISDWSSDVCSSDLLDPMERSAAAGARATGDRANRVGGQVHRPFRCLPVGRRGVAGGWFRPSRQGGVALGGLRSEERRGGKACGSTCRSWWWTSHEQKTRRRKLKRKEYI